MEKKYVYFVSYSHSLGFGRASAERKTEILSMEDIKKIEDAIEKSSGFKNVVILFYQIIKIEA